MDDKDHRYSHVHSVWKAGDLSSFSMIFRIIPRSVVAADMGLNYERLASKLENPSKFLFRDIQKLSTLVDIPFMDLIKLVSLAIQANQPA
ncbi:hypothetical protein [Dinghuibacter silviterrae]|uniref:Cro/C1-type helix-turn-helix DNA-binding protein n=1 Tax=Dinghuibacter silviterrae TaxID=1539049 RepID=A0A4V3GLI9_9BACT|nr:hypothetical protein [Dinghuibacter silviterrae]TDW99732.1 hypothetical protein EDB95_0743 [Dinghuibacter silviterrae]